MGFMNKGKVSMVITNRVLRFASFKSDAIDSLVSHGEVSLPADTIRDGKIINQSAFAEVVKQVVQKHKLKRKKIYFSVPDDTIAIRELQIPASLTKEEALGYIKTQLGHSFYLPFANPAIAVDVLDADEENRQILVYAYPKEQVQAFETIFEKVGLKPVVADLTSLSIYRYYYFKKVANKDHVLLIHWNQDALVLTAFRKHKAIFTRYMKVDIGDDNREESIHQYINDFIIEINRIIDFYHFSITNGEFQINQLLLTGDFSFLQSVKTALSESTELPIHEFQDDKSLILPAKYLDVMGLALKKVHS